MPACARKLSELNSDLAWKRPGVIALTFPHSDAVQFWPNGTSEKILCKLRIGYQFENRLHEAINPRGGFDRNFDAAKRCSAFKKLLGCLFREFALSNFRNIAFRHYVESRARRSDL